MRILSDRRYVGYQVRQIMDWLRRSFAIMDQVARREAEVRKSVPKRLTLIRDPPETCCRFGIVCRGNLRNRFAGEATKIRS